MADWRLCGKRKHNWGGGGGEAVGKRLPGGFEEIPDSHPASQEVGKQCTVKMLYGGGGAVPSRWGGYVEDRRDSTDKTRQSKSTLFFFF